METSLITQLGVGGVFAFLIIKMVLDFLGNKKKNGNNGYIQKINDLHKWHQADDKGIQEWKNPHLADAIEHLSTNLTEQTKALGKMCNVLDGNASKINEIHKKIDA